MTDLRSPIASQNIVARHTVSLKHIINVLCCRPCVIDTLSLSLYYMNFQISGKQEITFFTQGFAVSDLWTYLIKSTQESGMFPSWGGWRWVDWGRDGHIFLAITMCPVYSLTNIIPFCIYLSPQLYNNALTLLGFGYFSWQFILSLCYLVTYVCSVLHTWILASSSVQWVSCDFSRVAQGSLRIANPLIRESFPEDRIFWALKYGIVWFQSVKHYGQKTFSSQKRKSCSKDTVCKQQR